MRCRGIARIAKVFADQREEKTVWPECREVNEFVCGGVISFLPERLARDDLTGVSNDAHLHSLIFVTYIVWL